MKMEKALQGAYSGAAFVGKAKVGIMSVLWTSAIILMCVSAIMSIRQPVKRSAQIEATVASASCYQVVKYTTNNKNHYGTECDVTVNYTVGGQSYVGKIKTDKTVMEGNKISIYYDPSNPTDISYNNFSFSKVGWILMAIVSVMGLFVFGNLFLVSKYKPYAAYQGVKTIF